MDVFFAKAAVYVPVLLGAASISAIQLGKRKLAVAGSISPLQLLVVWYATAAALFAGLYLVLWSGSAPTLLDGFWNAVLGTTAANIFIQYFNVRAAACAKGEVSLTAPLQAMTPGLITILGLTLGEFPSAVGIGGIALMACGSYVLLWDGAPERWYEYFGPFKRLALLTKFHFLSPAEQSKTLAVYWSLGSAALGTIGLLFDGLFTRRGVNVQGLTLGGMAQISLLASVYLLWYIAQPDTPNGGRLSNGFFMCFRKPFVTALLIIAAAWVLHVYLINPSFQHTYVAHVGTLKRFSILLSVVLGYLLYREEGFSGPIWRVVRRQRFWAAVLIIVGVLCISLDDLPTRIAVKMEGIGI